MQSTISKKVSSQKKNPGEKRREEGETRERRRKDEGETRERRWRREGELLRLYSSSFSSYYYIFLYQVNFPRTSLQRPLQQHEKRLASPILWSPRQATAIVCFLFLYFLASMFFFYLFFVITFFSVLFFSLLTHAF